jgi:hypothetical protein
VTIEWAELLEEALYFKIDDTLIDKLVDKKGLFKPCPVKASDIGAVDKKKVVRD